jgi:hypothetical protein
MRMSPDSEANAALLSNAAIFVFDERFVLGDVRVTKDCRHVLIETGPVDPRILRDLLSAWGSVALDGPVAPAEDVAALRTPTEIRSEAIWSQTAVPSESIWAQTAVSLRDPALRASKSVADSEAEEMFESLGLQPAIASFHVPLSLIGTLPDGRKCAIVINRALKLQVSADPSTITVDTDGSEHELLVVNG